MCPNPSRSSICCCTHLSFAFHHLCWAHELNPNNVETLHLIGRLIGENTRALIKKQKLGHTLLHRDGQQDWMYSSVCVQFFFYVSVQLCHSHHLLTCICVLFAYVWIYPGVILMCTVLIITQISNYFYIIVNIIKTLYVVMHAFLSSQHPRTCSNVLVVCVKTAVIMHALHPVMNKW